MTIPMILTIDGTDYRINSVTSFGYPLDVQYRNTDPEIIAACGEWEELKSISRFDQIAKLICKQTNPSAQTTPRL